MIKLVGCGLMAKEYAKVLLALDVPFEVIGRSLSSASSFSNEVGVMPFVGGLEKYLKKNKVSNDKFIIATGVETLSEILELLIDLEFDSILIEKPAGISIEELLGKEEAYKSVGDKIFVAYNRRFYASVNKVFELIKAHGGLRSMHFEFTEWLHKIEPLKKAPNVKENWFFANSTHVIDLAFYIAGEPLEWSAFAKSGKVKWHDKTNFAGAGVTSKGALFSYNSNWESAGRWSIELMTDNIRIYLKPLEKIGIQEKGTINIVEFALNDDLDKDFKPGLYLQTKNFIENKTLKMVSLNQQIKNTKNIYLKILQD